MSGETSLDLLGAQRADAYAELQSLQAVEQGHLEMDTFIESLDQAKAALNDLAKDTKAVTGKIGDGKEKLEQATQLFDKAHGEMADYLKGLAEAGGKVQEGVEGLATKAGEAAGHLESLHGKLEYVQNLLKKGEGSATDILTALDEYLGDIVGKLEPLVGRIPGLGAFIQIWSKAIRSIAISAHAIEGEVAARNAMGREAGLNFDIYTKARGQKGQRQRRIAELEKKIEELDEQIGSQTAVADATDQRIRNAEWGLADSALEECWTKAGMTREEFKDKERRLAGLRRDITLADHRFRVNQGGLGLDGNTAFETHTEVIDVNRAGRVMDQAARDLERLLPEFESLRETLQSIYTCANAKLSSLGTDGIKNRMRMDATSLYGGMRVLGDPANLRLERTTWGYGLDARSVHAIEQDLRRHEERKRTAVAAPTAPAKAALPKKRRKVAMAGAGAAVLIGTGAYLAFGGSPACAASTTDPDCPPKVAVGQQPSNAPTTAPSAPASPIVDPSMDASFAGAVHTLGAFTPDGIAAMLRAFSRDELLDIIYSISSIEPGRRDARADIIAYLRTRLGLTGPLFDSLLGNTEFPCGRRDDVIVVCTAGAPTMPEGEYVLVTSILEAEIDVAGGPAGTGVYAYVVDADGDPANDWRPQGGFDWDYFQGTDTWIQVTGDLATQSWEMTVSRVTAEQQTIEVEMAVRAIIRGNSIVFVVPATEVPPDAPYRVSAFVHDGTYAPEVSGGDVSGTDPTQPLTR